MHSRSHNRWCKVLNTVPRFRGPGWWMVVDMMSSPQKIWFATKKFNLLATNRPCSGSIRQCCFGIYRQENLLLDCCVKEGRGHWNIVEDFSYLFGGGFCFVTSFLCLQYLQQRLSTHEQTSLSNLSSTPSSPRAALHCDS